MITRAQVETALITQFIKQMQRCDLDVSSTGTNAVLAGVLIRAMQAVGYSPASIVSISDADLATIASEDLPLFMILARVYTIDAILSASTTVDWSMGGRSESASKIIDLLREMRTSLLDDAARDFGYGASSLSAGTITLDFAAKDEDPWTSSQSG